MHPKIQRPVNQPSISHTMWDRRTSATAGLDRLHRPSIRHQLKDGPSTDKPEIYLYEHSYSPANALGIAVSSFNSRLNNHQKPQRPPRPERPEIVHDKQILPLFAAASRSSTEGIGMYVHLPSYHWNWLVWPWLRHADCYPILPRVLRRHLVLMLSFAREHMPVRW